MKLKMTNNCILIVDDEQRMRKLIKDFLAQKGILAGVKLDNQRILVCTTELIDKEDIDCYIEAAKPFSFNRLSS